MRRETDQVNGRTRSIHIAVRVAAGAMIVALAAACGGERAADKLYRQGSEQVAKGDTKAAVQTFERILREHPESEAAVKARRDITVYRGLAEAVERFPQRRAREIVVQAARAVERFRRSSGRWPASMAELVPDYIDREPDDPWSRPILYEAIPGGAGYKMKCLGADGAPGGEGDDADLVVVNGEIVGDPR